MTFAPPVLCFLYKMKQKSRFCQLPKVKDPNAHCDQTAGSGSVVLRPVKQRQKTKSRDLGAQIQKHTALDKMK